MIGNEVSGATLESPDWSGSGILVSGSSNVLVSNNYVHDCEGGIAIQGYAEYRDAPAENNIVENNLVKNNESGIIPQTNSIGTIIRYNDVLNNDEGIGVMAMDYSWEHSTPSGTEIHSNNIVGNVNYGVKSGLWGSNTGNILAEEVDATNNWWGSASGPTHASNTYTVPAGDAQGDAVVSDLVDFVPWLNALYDTGVSFAPVTTTAPVDSFASIQAGGVASNPNGTVNVAAGTYAENIVIDKWLTLQGAGSGSNPGSNTVITSSADETPVIEILAGGASDAEHLVVKDLRVTGATGSCNNGSGILVRSNEPIAHITFDSVASVDNEGYGIAFDGYTLSDMILKNCFLSENLHGFRLPSSANDVSGIVVNDCDFDNNVQGGIMAYSQGYLDGLTVSGGSFTNNAFGIMLGAESSESRYIKNVSVTGATFDDNNKDPNYALGFWVYVWGATDHVIENIDVHNCSFTNHDNYGVGFDDFDLGYTGTYIDATNNWWGANDGPSTSPGSGDKVSANVDYDPWHLKQITLAVSNPTESSIDLSWATTGAWEGDYFDVRYRTSKITSGNWKKASRVGSGEPPPSTTCNASQGMKVSGLSSDTTYYFGLKLIDGDIGSSEISNIVSATTLTTAPIDTTPPSAITDLEAAAGKPPTKKVILSWTAKGDDGTDGIASEYIIKQSTSEITAANFDSATTVRNNLRCKSNGESESFTVRRLTPNTTYYFAIKIQDEVPNTSDMSNWVSITTANVLPTVTNISPTTADNGAAGTLTITGTNFIGTGTTVVRLISDDNTFHLTNVTCVSATELTAVVPIGAPTGTYKARVINNNGRSAPSSATYIVTAAPAPPPVVTNLIPQMAASSTEVSGVKIFGKNFTGATAVRFGNTAATSFTKISDTKITADVPGLAAGEYDVKVTTPAPAGTNEVSAVKFVVSDPVVVDKDTTEDTTTSEVIDLGDLGDTNVIPVQITLTTDTSETATQATDTDAEIEVVIPPQTTVTDSEGNDYTGDINPPRVVKPDESVLTGLPEDAIVIEMGNPEETIHFNPDFVATVIVTASAEPDIYYYNKDTGAYELAGKTGTEDGIHYVPGGTVLGLENSTYTIGLLLDHMSTFIASVESLIPPAPPPAAVGGGDGGGGPAPTPAGTTDIRGKASATGRFWYPVTAISEDKLCRLSIPRGTVGLTEELETLTKITMLIMDEPPAPPEDAHIVGLAYDFGPDGATFDPAITLTWSYEPADIPEGIAEEDLVIAYYDEAAGEWVELEGCVVENNTITAPVSHFTTFAIIGTVPPPPPPAPAAFSVTDLSIQPAEVGPKETVTIRLSVANTGGTEGSYSVILMINGVKEAEKSVTIAAGKSQDVSFSVTREEVASYSVTVDGLSASFVVVAAPPPPPVPVPAPAPPPAKPINWPLIGGIIGGVIVVGLGIFFLVRRRAY